MALFFGGNKGGQDQLKLGELMTVFTQHKPTFTSHENAISNTPQQPTQEKKKKKTLFSWWSHGSAVF